MRRSRFRFQRPPADFKTPNEAVADFLNLHIFVCLGKASKNNYINPYGAVKKVNFSDQIRSMERHSSRSGFLFACATAFLSKKWEKMGQKWQKAHVLGTETSPSAS